MTEIARRVIQRLPRRSRPPQPPPTPAARQLRVEVAGAIDGQAVAAMTASLGELLRGLGLDATVDVASSRRADTDLAVSLDGHPVALVPEKALAGDDRPTQTLEQRVTTGVLRRLPLLLGDRLDGRPTASYLLAVGCAPPSADADGDPDDIERAERLLDDRSREDIILEVPASTLRRVADDDQRAVADLRETEFRKRGVVYPDMRLRVTDEEPGRVRLRFNDVALPAADLGVEAGWPEVVRHLGTELAARRHWFLRLSHLTRMLDQDLSYLYPALVDTALANYPAGVLTGCLRELLRSGRRIRNLPRILWLMLEQDDVPGGADMLRLSESPRLAKSRYRPSARRDPVLLASLVRTISAEETWRLRNYRAPANAVRLPTSVEERLAAGGEASAKAEWAAVHALASAPGAGPVVTRTYAAIPSVRDALQALERPPQVVASQELPPDADLAAFRILGQEKP